MEAQRESQDRRVVAVGRSPSGGEQVYCDDGSVWRWVPKPGEPMTGEYEWAESACIPGTSRDLERGVAHSR